MKHPLFLAESLASAGLPLALLWKGVLDLRRDFLVLGVYLQFLLYVYVGPYLLLRGGPDLTARHYEQFGAWAFPLCGGVLIGTYLLALPANRRGREAGQMRLETVPGRYELLLLVLVAFSGSFWAIAWSHEIVLRRIGDLLNRQFTLRLPEFAVYRLYVESLPFLVAVVIAGLVVSGPRLSWISRLMAALTLLSAYVYWTLNSRLGLALLLLIVLGTWALLWRGGSGFWPRFAAGCVFSIALLLYSNSTTEKVRVVTANGESAWRGFLPFAAVEEKPARVAEASKPTIPTPVPSRDSGSGSQSLPPPAGSQSLSPPARPSAGLLTRGLTSVSKGMSKGFFYVASAEMPIATRLNGLDLIVQMQPALETKGFAWGKAWKVPVALVVLPLVDPSKARAYKSTFDVAAKNYLIRNYTGLPDPDHVSCILTDAYGNFGVLGFVLVGAVLGSAFGLGVRSLRWPVSAVVAVVALFFLCHLFEFEQEFVSALLLWVKKLPALIGLIVLNPFSVSRAPEIDVGGSQIPPGHPD